MKTTWPLRDCARAADMKPRALRQLFDTHILKFRGDDKQSTGTGVPVRLSTNRAYEAAIVQHLNRLGLPSSRAASAAFEFTISGNAGRAASHLFTHGKTLLAISPTGTKVQNLFLDETLAAVSGGNVCTITLDLNKIVERVDTSLKNQKALALI